MSHRALRAGLGALLALAAVACGRMQDARTETFSKLPDWSGIWISAEPVGTIDVDGYPKWNPATDWKVIGVTAPLNESARAKLGALMANPQAMISFKAPSWGFPLMMESPTALQFTITPEETLIVNYYRDVRHVYTDGRPLPAAEDRWPGPWGESVGRWEEDTLAIETVSVASRAVTNLPLPLFSENAVYVERLRKVNADRIESEITVTDPETLTEPWTFLVGYKRATDVDRMFHLPFDNDRSAPVEGGVFTISPPSE